MLTHKKGTKMNPVKLSLKEMAFILEVMDRTQLQGIDAKQLQLAIMRKMAGPLEAAQKAREKLEKTKKKK